MTKKIIVFTLFIDISEVSEDINRFEHQVSQTVRKKYQSAEINDGLTERYVAFKFIFCLFLHFRKIVLDGIAFFHIFF